MAWFNKVPLLAVRFRRIGFAIFYEERRTVWKDEAERVADSWREKGHRARIVKDGPFADWKVFRSSTPDRKDRVA